MTANAHFVTLHAPAKLTLSLRITGRRDDGYHLIDAEMVSLDLADTVELTVDDDATPSAGGRSVEVLDAMTGEAIDVGPPEQNLAIRALRLLDRVAAVRVLKRIPAGAGLGGGSSDAAAILRWGGLTDLGAAARLGADVPFCLVGGRARVGGIGEVIEPLPFEPRELTLLTPPFGCSTVAVYQAWDRMGGPTSAGPTSSGPNDLESAALAVEPRLAEWRDQLADATGRAPRLAGSGSTWFVEGAFPGPGHLVTRTIPAPA
jgi:4-diphosphocytidyl-2-C-methyl-D-erythritol kinase